LLDILGQIPGVSIARSGGIGGQIYLRGFSSNNMRAPFFADGDRLHGRNTLQFAYFDPEEIERVEVIRGPASVLYGSDALTGLVNLILRHPNSDPNGPFHFVHGGISFGFGTNATSLSTYEWAEGAGQGFNVRGGVSYRSANAYETPLGLARNSDFRNFGGTFMLRYSPTADQHLEATFHQTIETDGRAGGVGGVPGYPFLNVRQSPNDLTMGRLDYTGEFANSLFTHVEASTYINYFDTHLLTLNTSSATKTIYSDSHVIGPTVVGARVLGVIPWNLGPWGALTTKMGGDTFHEARPGSTTFSTTSTLNAAGQVVSVKVMPTTQVVPDSSQTNVGVFMLNEWTPVAPLTFSAGGRLDYFNTQTNLSPLVSPALLPAYEAASDANRVAPTGSIGFVYRILPVLDLVGSIQTSFRQPTNAELFSSTATTIPNPTLKPETALTYEGAVNVHFDNATLAFTAFHSLYQNLILTVPVTYEGLNTFTQNQNVGSAEIDGLEAAERWQVTPAVNIFNSLTLLRGTNTSTETPLPISRRCAHATGYNMRRPIPAIRWKASSTGRREKRGSTRRRNFQRQAMQSSISTRASNSID
jgi:hemoglobin/transferrin/lactoferrin receptor protein